MKVLICWNTAAAFNPLADWLLKNGHDVRIVMRSGFDVGDCTADHPAGVMVNSATKFYRECMSQVRKFKPDIIQASSSIKALVLVRLIAPRSLIVLTYHGSDVRGRKEAHPESRLADFVTVTTQDLSKYGVWMNRSIGSHFVYRGGRKPNTALMLYHDNFISDQRKLAKDWCDYKNIKLTILDRTKADCQVIPYHLMPEFYSQFEYYLEFKGQTGDNYALSKAAMEAFCCGCKVIHESGPITSIKLAKPDEYYSLYNTLKRASIFVATKRFICALWYLGVMLTKELFKKRMVER
jgi:hypothetical protein